MSNSPDSSKETQEQNEPSTPTPSTSSVSSFWGFLNSAKEKSAYVLEAVKKDLDEISSTVKSEAAVLTGSLHMDDENSTVNIMKKSLSSFFGTVSEALNPSMLDDESEAVLITNDDTIVLTGFHKHLAELQANDKIYLEEPCDELAEKYKRWLEVVEQDQFTQDRLDRLLANSEILKEKYEKFVPDQVSHFNFWKRYLFKKALMEDELADSERRRKADMVAEEAKEEEPVKPAPVAQIQTEQPKKVNEPIDELNWEADFELSEEEQARLLAEYEQEIKEREGKDNNNLAREISESEASKETKQKEPASAAAKTPATSKSSNVQKKNQKKSSTSNNKTNVQSKPTASAAKSKAQQSKTTKAATVTSDTSDDANKDELKIEKDHFTKEENSSTNSDESWIEV